MRLHQGRFLNPLAVDKIVGLPTRQKKCKISWRLVIQIFSDIQKHKSHVFSFFRADYTIVASNIQRAYHPDEGTGDVSKSDVFDRMSLFSFIIPSSVTVSRAWSWPLKNDPPRSKTFKNRAYLFSITCSYTQYKVCLMNRNLRFRKKLKFLGLRIKKQGLTSNKKLLPEET